MELVEERTECPLLDCSGYRKDLTLRGKPVMMLYCPQTTERLEQILSRNPPAFDCELRT